MCQEYEYEYEYEYDHDKDKEKESRGGRRVREVVVIQSDPSS